MLLNRSAPQPAGGVGRWAARAVVIIAASINVACARVVPDTGLHADPSTPESRVDVVQMTGSSTIAPLIVEFATAFERRYLTKRIDVETGGPSRGTAVVRRGTAGIGMVSCSLRPGECDPQGHLIARDGVAMIVHASNPVAAALSRDEIVGMIFRRPNPLPVSIAGDIGGPLKDHGVASRPERRDRGGRARREVGFWSGVGGRLRAPALSLSGGQRQRLCIGRCLALEPVAQLLDGPCSAPDPMATSVVEDAILVLRGRYTTVIATHNLARARRIADSAAVFWQVDARHGGTLVEFAPTREIFERPRQELTSMYTGGIEG